jgi:hypothetical protein
MLLHHHHPPHSHTHTHQTNTPTHQAAWDKTEDKPAVIVLATAAFVALLAAGSVADAIDRVPLISGLMRLVGLIVTGWFTYRYLAFKPDREELLRNIDAYLAKILGK